MAFLHKVVALSGGTGSAKFLRGLQQITRFTAIVNVADNAWFHGLYVCPDIDTVTYTLAGLADTERGWGIAGDKFTALQQLTKLGSEGTWFRIGDMDMATDVFRTAMTTTRTTKIWERRGREEERGRRGEKRTRKSLTEVTSLIARSLGVQNCSVIPATDSHVETHIMTSEMGEMHLQEYWVRERGELTPRGIRYVGAGEARATKEVVRNIRSAERLIITPANPLTSIMPILSIGGFKRLLRESEARRIAVSPMIGDKPFSGPAAKLMASQGIAANSLEVARLYKGLIDAIVVDESDGHLATAIEREGMSCILAPTTMRSREDETKLARVAMEA
jgi:LPPG:FO 2-phospho-L-lactate transferase